MTDQQSILNHLTVFRQQEKFSDVAWHERGLTPSGSDRCAALEQLFNDCTDQLIAAIRSGASQRACKSILKKELTRLRRDHYDTEEAEFICDYFHLLSRIVGVDLKSQLNSWLYGSGFSTLLKIISFFRGKEKIVEVRSQDCTNCGAKLETYIIKKQSGIPDHSWSIIQCNHCKDYNLLSLGPNIKMYRFGEYKLSEQLPKSEFTEEQARIRLEQIRYFRR